MRYVKKQGKWYWVRTSKNKLSIANYVFNTVHGHHMVNFDMKRLSTFVMGRGQGIAYF